MSLTFSPLEQKGTQHPPKLPHRSPLVLSPGLPSPHPHTGTATGTAGTGSPLASLTSSPREKTSDEQPQGTHPLLGDLRQWLPLPGSQGRGWLRLGHSCAPESPPQPPTARLPALPARQPAALRSLELLDSGK